MATSESMAKPAKVLLNVPAIKADFPILQRTVHDKRLVYLDSAATSQKPQQVIDATSDFYSRYNANVHRAIYELGEEATREYEGAREKIAAFIHAKSPNDIAFTKSTTESINVVAYGYGLKGKIQKGDEIVGSVMEHHSNHVPWHFVKDHKGAVLKYVDVTDDGTLRMEQYDELLSKRTKIVTVTLCSNVLGTINPVREIAKRAHEVGAICVVDAAQAAPHMRIDVQDLNADFLAFSGHKMLGPTGIGVLYGKPELLEETEPLLGGGEMIREVHLGSAKWNDVPFKFEGGTPNIAGAIGLGVAVDYLTKLGMDAVRAHEMEMTQDALEKLDRLRGVRTYGPRDVKKRAGVVSFTIDNAHPHDIASILDVEGICIRSGHHCAQPLMERYELPATARASFYIYNDIDDIDALVGGIKRVQEVFA
ncbi:MAG TPA: cysteine desulfurase [Thermoplasmata archaeon]|nr:cysteine desulfurase [Thermoplasmata archaeon]